VVPVTVVRIVEVEGTVVVPRVFVLVYVVTVVLDVMLLVFVVLTVKVVKV
jgi:hypothetical protein